MAQVYSQNAVGYVNTVCYPGFNLIANPLSQTATSLAALLPTVPDGTTFYGFSNVSGFSIKSYIDGVGWDPDGNDDISFGKGFFIQNAGASPFTLTFVGDVGQGNLSVPLVNGFNLVASKVPQGGLVTTTLQFPGEDNDTLYIYDNGPGGDNGYLIRQFIDGVGWDPDEPTLGVGKAMWINSVGTHASWARNFSVN